MTSPSQKRAQDLRDLSPQDRNPQVGTEVAFLEQYLSRAIDSPSFTDEESSYMWDVIARYADSNK
jgi:hypothetical protein